MRIQHYDVSDLVSKLRVGPYYGRSFKRRVLPVMQSVSDKPLICRRMKAILESQGYGETIPSLDNKSVYDPRDLFSALERYATVDPRTKIDGVAFRDAVNATFAAFAKPKDVDFLSVLELDEVAKHVHLSHSSGAPEFDKKGKAINSDLDRAVRILAGEVKKPPCIAYKRQQHGKSGPKTRLVWGYPQSVSLIEGMFAVPLIDHFLDAHSPMAFGLRKMELSARLVSIRNRGHVYGFDVSRYDASMRPSLIQIAFNVIKTWFHYDYHWMLDEIENYFIHTPIIMPDGNVYKKTRGVPSGSWFTQHVDSIVNLLMLQYCIRAITGRCLNNNQVLVLGDDSLVGLLHKINIQEMRARAAELGFILSVDKSNYSTQEEAAHFLGHWWSLGLPHRPVHELIIRAIYPERSRDSSTDGLARAVEFLGDAPEAWELIMAVLSYEGVPLDRGVSAILRCLPLAAPSGLQKVVEDTTKFRMPRNRASQAYVAPLLS